MELILLAVPPCLVDRLGADEFLVSSELATDAITELEGTISELNAVLTLLGNGGKLYNKTRSEIRKECQ